MANISRRDFLRKAIYVSPVILSLPAVPSFAQSGSGGGTGSGGSTGGGPLNCGSRAQGYCYYAEPGGGYSVEPATEIDPNAAFCGCDS
jgi:uncharacterized membrane protein